ncbi:MAG: VOC family protein [Saccharofermentanales bacterium]
MNVSHIIYKVDNLQQAVEHYRARGFTVEYGKAKHPHNALIYFSEGPFIELLAGTHMPKFMKRLLRFFGKGPQVDRLDGWDQHPGGPCGLALETYEDNMQRECAILADHGIGCTQVPTRRNDIKGRKLRFKVAYPDDTRVPFMMTYFNIDPKPKNYTHPNGVTGISEVTFYTSRELFPLMQALCDDPLLTLKEGRGEIHFTCASASDDL